MHVAGVGVDMERLAQTDLVEGVGKLLLDEVRALVDVLDVLGLLDRLSGTDHDNAARPFEEAAMAPRLGLVAEADTAFV